MGNTSKKSKSKKKKGLTNTKKDLIVIFIVLLSAALLILFFQQTVGGGNKIRIRVDEKHHIESVEDDSSEMNYYLSKDNEIKIYDDNGNVTNIVVINDENAYMKYSTCSGHDCIKMGKISSGDQTIVCIPNGISIEVIQSDASSEGAW